MIELYRALWRVSGRRQLVLALIAIAVAALAAAPLAYQKSIVNGLAPGPGQESVDGLMRLGLEMICVITLSLSLKWALGHLSGMAGEAAILAIRRRIVDDALEGGLQRPGAPSLGAVATMVSTEAEELGRFAGDAVAQPLVQLGTLVSVIGFIAANQPRLGAVALLVILPQALLVLFTQRRVNALVAERVGLLRHGTGSLRPQMLEAEADEVRRTFDKILTVQRRVFFWKLSTKFLLSALSGIGAVGILMIGGWLVLQGRSDVGTVVAATAGLARLQQPWAQLIAFYRETSAVRVKFDLLRAAAADVRA